MGSNENGTGGKPPLQKLEITHRCIVDDNGGSTRQLHVYCPGWEQTMRVEDCTQCPRCEAVFLTGDTASSFLACHVESSREGGPVAYGPSVGELMTRQPVCVREDVSLKQVLLLLMDGNIGALPVVTQEGIPFGLVSKTDVVRRLHELGRLGADGPAEERVLPLAGSYRPDPSQAPTVRELMTPVVVTVDERDSVISAASLMAEEGLHRVPVVGTDGTVVGVLSTMDITAWVGGRVPSSHPRPSGRISR